MTYSYIFIGYSREYIFSKNMCQELWRIWDHILLASLCVRPCHSLMNAGRRCKALGSEMKKSLIQYTTSAVARVSACKAVLWAPVRTGRCKKGQLIPPHAVDCVTSGTLSLGNLNLLEWTINLSSPSLKEKH